MALVVAFLIGGTVLAAPASAATVAVAAENFAFNPQTVQVNAGDVVTWTNNDGEPHTVSADDGSWSFVINPGESGSHTFSTNGTVPYYCKLHGAPGGQGMSGVVQVGELPNPATIHISGVDNVARSVAWSQATYPNGADFALLGRSDGFADSLSTGGVQGKLHAPLLLTATGALDARVKTELARLKARVVYLFGGTSALSQGVADELSSSGYTVRRVAGVDRIATATAAAETFFPEATHALLVRGFGDQADPTRAFADSLAAGSLAASEGVPVLFSTTAALSPVTKAYVQQHPIHAVHLVGGTGALSDQVEKDLQGMGLDTERMAGFTRADTARIVSEGIDAGEVVLVNGSDPNAWADGFAAAGRGSVVLLTASDALPGATAQTMANYDVDTGIVCGATVSTLACTRAEQMRALNIDFPTQGAFVPTAANGSGTASGIYFPSTTDACYDVFAASPDITGAAIHRVVDNSTVLQLKVDDAADDDPFGCSYNLPAATVADLKANPGDYKLVLNIGSTTAEGTYTNLDFFAQGALLGESEVPGPGDPSGAGFGFVFTTDTPNQLCGGMVLFGLSAQPTAAHIHDGDTGVSGPVVVPLATPTNGDFSENIGCYTVDGALLNDIKTTPGGFYMNVHTSAFPNGAIRGQLVPIPS